MKASPITLESLADGAAVELFAHALAEVLKNIDDPNTDWKKARQVSLDFTFKCDESRRVGFVEVACSTKLAGVKGVVANLYIGRHEGALVAIEPLRQEDMFTTPAGRPAVVEGGAAAS